MVEIGAEGSVVRLAGRLTAEFVKDVEHLCLSTEPPVLIDASELRFCDPDGLAFLVRARVQGGAASVEGLSEYLLMRVRVEERRGSSGVHR
jgi:anti-anti-sigma regulatory factor